MCIRDRAVIKREGAAVAGELHLFDVRAGREVLYRVYRERLSLIHISEPTRTY